MSGGWIGRLTVKLISLPGRLLSRLTEVMAQVFGFSPIASLKNVPKSTDNMAPESPFIKAISSMSVAPGPGAVAHSIPPVTNPDDPREEWNDGVLQHKSVHVDGVASELTVRYAGHSAQDHQQAIEEIRRILIENLKEP